MSDLPHHDRFTLPNQIPDASDRYWRLSPAEQAEWRARGLAHAAGRGWRPVAGSGRPVPLGRAAGGDAWPKDWLPGDPPVRYVDADALGAELVDDPAAEARKFDAAARVRFLDCLATLGEVRAVAARIGVSRETCYRARRRWPDFARLWDAAMLHARARAEGELASRAYDGVKQPVFVRGECVATWNRHDPRYLAMLLARLDRKAEACPEAAEVAERFDELLALHAGHDAPEGFAEAAGLWNEDRDLRSEEPDGEMARVPTRREYAAWCAARAVEGLKGKAEERAYAKAWVEAEHAWDRWRDDGFARVDALVLVQTEDKDELAGEAESPLPLAGGAGGGPVDQSATPGTPSPNRCSSGTPAVPRKREGDSEAPDEPPIEVKSAPAHRQSPSVSHVSTPPAGLRADERLRQECILPHGSNVSPQRAETGEGRSVPPSRGGVGPSIPPVQTGVASPSQESDDA
jgi:hypothetical protein